MLRAMRNAGDGVTVNPKRARRGKPRIQAKDNPTNRHASVRPYQPLRARIMILKPFFDLLSLGSKDHALPFHGTCSFAVFRHHVGILIEHFDDARRSRALETVTARRRFVFFGIRFRGNPTLGTTCVRCFCEPAKRFLWLQVRGIGSSLIQDILCGSSRCFGFPLPRRGFRRWFRLAPAFEPLRYLLLLFFLTLLFLLPLLERLWSATCHSNSLVVSSRISLLERDVAAACYHLPRPLLLR